MIPQTTFARAFSRLIPNKKVVCNPPYRQFFTTVRQQISMDFDFSSLQITDVFYGRPFTLIPERILRSGYSQSPKRIDLCATSYGNAICS